MQENYIFKTSFKEICLANKQAIMECSDSTAQINPGFIQLSAEEFLAYGTQSNISTHEGMKAAQKDNFDVTVYAQKDKA